VSAVPGPGRSPEEAGGPGAAERIAALETRRLTVSYGTAPALWDVDASFPRGALSAIVGPNGAGKSTLLRAALGLVPADAGQTFVLGHPARAALERVAYVPQRDAVDWDFPISVREVVEMGCYRRVGWIRRLPRAERELAADCVARVGMAPYADRQIADLSGGQRQRVFLARALVQRADVMLLDEPFSGIDIRTEASILGLLSDLRAAGSSVVVVHHDIETVREKFDWALLLNVRAVACGPVGEALSREQVHRAYGAGEPEPGGAETDAWAG
jgi:manganese/zinc/iron transport system ATP- binding protein